MKSTDLTPASSFYVYVYIDPRNYQEFYYGKGQGDRKLAHLNDGSDSEKTRIINEIKEAKLEPIIKVIARNLTEEQALLVEKTLIWKLGKTLTNKSSGHYSEHFRPQNTLYKDLYGFDFENGVYCIHIDEKNERSWNDSKKYGFISGGQDWESWGKYICNLRPNDIVCAYVAPFGYVGIGRVTAKAVPPHEFTFEDKPLAFYNLEQPWVLEVKENVRDGEYLLKVEWLSTREKSSNIGCTIEYFRSRRMLGSLEGQPTTLKLLEEEFKVSFNDLLLNYNKAS